MELSIDTANVSLSSARRSGILDLGISSFVTGWIVVAFILSSREFEHWFIVPVYLCGSLIGTDVVAWFRGKISIFDPVGIVGLLGYHFFFFAPLLHVHWDYWMKYVSAIPGDWRPWLGGMAWLNLGGILIYRWVRNVQIRRPQAENHDQLWQLNTKRFASVLGIALLVTGLLQIAVYSSYGGLAGYMNTYSTRHADGGFEGMGLVFSISESFPILAFMGYAVYARGSKRTRNWMEIGAVLLLFVILKMFFGGFRGSRSNVIWGVFWAVVILHYWIRPITKKMILGGLAVLVVFMYIYGFYKSFGTDVLQEYRQADGSLAALQEESGRSLQDPLLLDLARADIQAFILYRLSDPLIQQEYQYEYAEGRTYLGALSLAIPRQVWPDRPPTKVKAGTELIYGSGSYDQGAESSRVYGLAGEAMLNFGPLAVPLCFIVLGGVVGRVRRLPSTWHTNDSRFLVFPLLVNLCFVVLVSDSDNLVFFLVKNGLVPFAVVWLASSRLNDQYARQEDVELSGRLPAS
jgi:hypothetical protein